MIDIGTAPGTTNTSRIEVNAAHPGTTLLIGAGVVGGPSRKIDVFEDVLVHGNARAGEVHVVRLRLEQGVDGVIDEGVDDEVPRILKLTGDARLHVIGGGPLNGPGRDIVLWDDVRITNDLVVANDATITNDVTVGNDATVTNDLTVGVDLSVQGLSTLTGNVTMDGDLDVGATDAWGRVRAENAVYAAGTWHLHNRGGPDILNLVCGFGWDVSGAGAHGNTSSTFVQHDFQNAPYAGSNVAMLVMDTPIECATAVITMYRVGEYDPTLTLAAGTPVLVSSGTFPTPPDNVVLPQLVVKGLANPGPGGSPGVIQIVNCAQQVEIEFYNLGGIATIPAPGVEGPPANADDFVFDIKVCGCPCTPVE